MPTPSPKKRLSTNGPPEKAQHSPESVPLIQKASAMASPLRCGLRTEVSSHACPRSSSSRPADCSRSDRCGRMFRRARRRARSGRANERRARDGHGYGDGAAVEGRSDRRAPDCACRHVPGCVELGGPVEARVGDLGAGGQHAAQQRAGGDPAAPAGEAGGPPEGRAPRGGAGHGHQRIVVSDGSAGRKGVLHVSETWTEIPAVQVMETRQPVR